MLFKNMKLKDYKNIFYLVFDVVMLTIVLIFIISSVNSTTESDKDILSYSVKVRDAVEYLDKIFERSEVNVNTVSDSIATSYDTSKLQDKNYNQHYIKNIDGLIKSALTNSPNVDGSWFQLNADLPFSIHDYNWYEFKDDQFVNIRDQFDGSPSADRKITPDDDPYYFDAINSKKTSWSGIYKDADTNDSMITISSPVYKNEVLIGVVGIDINVKTLQEALKDIQLILGNSDLYLLDKNSKLILSQTAISQNSEQNDYPFLGLFQENKVGPIEYNDHFKKKTGITIVLSNNYKLIIGMDNKVIFKGTSQLVTIIYSLYVLLLIATLVTFLKQKKINDLKLLVDDKNGETSESENKDENA